MTRILTFLFLLLITGFNSVHGQSLESIFNGKDFTGWVLPEDNIWYSAQDGILALQSGPDKKGTILWTEKEYKDFVIEADFKFGDGTVDSGFFIRSEHDQIQIGESGSLKRDMTCSPYIPGEGYPVEAKVKDVIKMDDWNTIKVQAKGNKYTAWLNGKKVMTYKSDTAADMGPIGIQLHPNRDMSMQYRNIKAASL